MEIILQIAFMDTQGDISKINTSDIASIDILKDASRQQRYMGIEHQMEL